MVSIQAGPLGTGRTDPQGTGLDRQENPSFKVIESLRRHALCTSDVRVVAGAAAYLQRSAAGLRVEAAYDSSDIRSAPTRSNHRATHPASPERRPAARRRHPAPPRPSPIPSKKKPRPRSRSSAAPSPSTRPLPTSRSSRSSSPAPPPPMPTWNCSSRSPSSRASISAAPASPTPASITSRAWPTSKRSSSKRPRSATRASKP